MKPQPRTVLLDELRAGAGARRLYAILDGARDKRLVPWLTGSTVSHMCLYSGQLHPRMAAVAPYLAWLDLETHFASWLISTGWGESWGIYFWSDADLPTLHRHFRRLLIVKNERGKRFY